MLDASERVLEELDVGTVADLATRSPRRSGSRAAEPPRSWRNASASDRIFARFRHVTAS